MSEVEKVDKSEKEEKGEEQPVSKKQKYRRPKPWDTPDIDKWKVEQWNPGNQPPFFFFFLSSFFSSLFSPFSPSPLFLISSFLYPSSSLLPPPLSLSLSPPPPPSPSPFFSPPPPPPFRGHATLPL